MSGTHTPISEFSSSQNSSTRSRTTRTVAIIKNHALEHRMNIERRIEEASFEIVKERQMEFDQNSDQEFLIELFGNDALSLFEGPVWIYVLERRRAIEVWNALMGPEDPSVARTTSPNTLRALYGLSLEQNALAGAPDENTAEEQIACLFQSSPPFRAAELSFEGQPEDYDEVDHLVGLDSEGEGEGELDSREVRSTRHSEVDSRRGSSSIASSGSKKVNGKAVPFKARPIPRTTLVPDIAPRSTRAAALRQGITVSPARNERPRVAPTKEELKQAFLDVPGHKRSNTIQVASTAPPVVAPRMTRAASLRINQKPGVVPSRTKPRPTSSSGPATTAADRIAAKERAEKLKATFEGVPGHKRRETITVASLQTNIQPRLNKSAELRAKKDNAPPSSYMFKSPSTPKVPGGRTPTQSRPASSMGSARPSSSMANLRTPAPSASSMTRTASQATSSTAVSVNGGSGSPDENKAPSSFKAPTMPARPPSIEPRSNRSALLRAKLMDNASAASTNGKTPVKKMATATRVKANRSSVAF